MTNRDEYNRLNSLWPPEVPKLTAPEAISAFKRLHRAMLGRPYEGKIQVTSGNRQTRLRGGISRVNPDRGWEHFCHDLSHHFHWQLHPEERPHSQRHLDLEFTIVRHVKAQGWLDGKLKRPTKPKAPTDIRQGRYGRVLKRLASWHAKLKRAETAIQKLERKRRYYERALTVPVNGGDVGQ